MTSSKRAAAEVTKSNRFYGHLVPREDSLTKQDDIVFCLRDAEENDENDTEKCDPAPRIRPALGAPATGAGESPLAVFVVAITRTAERAVVPISVLHRTNLLFCSS